MIGKKGRYKLDGYLLRLHFPASDISCPICKIGRLNVTNQEKREMRCSVCQRFFLFEKISEGKTRR